MDTVTATLKTRLVEKMQGAISNLRQEDGKDANKYCYPGCTLTESKGLVGCDGKDCDIKWFHYECVNMDESNMPKGDWTCLDCEPSKSVKND